MLCSVLLWAQTTLNIGSGSNMVVSGPTSLVLNAGQFVNNGNYTDNTGAVVARGAIDFSGTGIYRLNDLTFHTGTGSVSNINSLVSVYNRAYLRTGTLYANNLLYIRSDDNLLADMRVEGMLYNPVQGLVTRATVTTGSGCTPYTSNLTLNIFGPAMLFQWQSSPDGSFWTNITGATSGTYTASVATTTQYRCSLSTNNSTFTQATPAVELVHTGGLPAITGYTDVCLGESIALSIAHTGGTWSSSTPAIATIDPTTGMVTGISAGTTTITYTASTSCTQTVVFTVNPLPDIITGNASICKTSSSLLSSATPGGTWVSSNPFIASTPSTIGLVYGASLGTASIKYTLPTGCATTREVTVNPSITSAITGPSTVCQGTNITLSITESGGTWSSSFPTRASIDPSTGVVLGIGTGTSIITYSITADCYQTAVVTTNPLPKTIGGTGSVCASSSATLSSNPPGGTWSSSNTAVATIPIATSGTYTGITAGTARISYTLPTGCFSTRVVTVNPSPTPITGSLQSCIGRTILHSSTPTGGTWSSSTPARVTIDAAGFSTGVALGTSTISYTSPSGCRATAVVTVGALPTVTGPTLVCAGNSITLSSTPLGGTWVSSNPSGASVNPVGIVTGVATGVTSIRYTAANTCFRNTNVTVNAIVKPINGTLAICTGTSTTLTSATAGGTWQSGSTTVASIITATGVATGINAGTSTITYRTGANCFATRVLTVNPASTVAAISGPSIVCAGNTITLTNTTTGGVWSSSVTSVATISSTGIVSGIAPGTTVVSYTKTTSCGTSVATKVVTVNPIPDAGTISGTSPLCRTSTATFTSTVTGGTWSSNYTAGATVNASTGLVTGVAAGSFIISYRLTNSCGTAYATYPLTVIAAPSLTAITGATSVCEAASTTLANTTSAGTWTSTNTAAATINAATGLATGVAAGTTTISYSTSNICGSATVSRVLTVTPLPVAAVISGTATLSAGTTTTLTASPSGGTWLSAGGAIASINASGVVTGIATGNATISYTRANSCGSAVTTVAVTVTPAATPITGILAVCEVATSTLSNASAGGTWSTADGAIATVSSTGVVTGVAAGTTTVTYAFTSGGYVTAVVTVNAAPAAYTGSGIVCTGSQLNLGSIIPGCTWTSGNTARATVASTTGIVTGGTTLGTVNISYTNAAACRTITQLTVNAGVAAITGVTSPCVGNIITLATTTSGGTWTSSVTAHATIDASTGELTAVAGGTTTISYTVSAGCVRTTTVTVGTPPAITGNPSICFGQTSLLVSSGGTWSSSNPIVATVAASGFVTGVSLGTAVITYRSTANALCFVTLPVTVNPLPSAIVAPPALCPGQTATLTSTPAGGTWTSNFPAKASVDPSTGVVTGVIFNYTAISVVNISYTLPTGCGGIATVTINPLPSPIGGNRNICVAGSTTLTNSTTGGTWSSASPAIATAAAGGVVTGVSAGLTTISYTNALGCANTEEVTVNAMPGANTGLANLCLPSGTTLSNPAGAGTWTSSNTTIASVNFSSGAVTGINSGTANITYSKAAGCTSVTVVTVNAGLPAITGTAVVCVGLNTTLTNTTSGGTWSSNDPSVASISATGIVTGVSLGNSTITYSNGSCNTTREVTVNCFARPANPDVTEVAQTSFSLFPNPTTGNLTLATSVAGKATIFSVDGKEVQSYDVEVGNNNLNLPYNLATGVYMCRFIGNDGSSQLARLVLNH